MQRPLILLALSSALTTSVVSAAEVKIAKDMPFAQEDIANAKVINTGIDYALNKLGSKAVAHVDLKQDATYGFSANISKEKGSFRLGVLTADLQAALQAGNREVSQQASAALLHGLETLNAPAPLVNAAGNLSVALLGNIDMKATEKLISALLYPQLMAFIEAQGNTNHFYLGQWAETLNLSVAVKTADEKADVATGLIAMASSFTKSLTGKAELPAGVFNALGELSALAAKPSLGPRELLMIQSATATLKSLLG